MKFRHICRASLLAFGLCALPLLLRAEAPLTPEQVKTIQRCTNKYYDDINRCLREHPHLEYKDCAKAADGGFSVCMKRAGLLGRAAPPVVRPGGSAGDAPLVAPGRPTPPKRSQVDTGAAGKVVDRVKAATPSPIGTPRPLLKTKPTPTP